MNMQMLLLDSLNSRWNKYNVELQNCRDEFSEEAVHDFRVAARRLLASLDLLRNLVRGAKIKNMRRELKAHLDTFDDLRDTQVLLADISENIQDVPSLRPFEEYLQRREKKLMRSARKEIKSLETPELSRGIRKLEKAIAESTPETLDPLPAIDEAYARVIRRYERINPSQPATIHRVRIAFKKFRYMVESIHPILEGFPSKNYLKAMHDYQTLMGDIQDMETALRELAEFEEHAPGDYDPAPVRSYYNEHHTLSMSRYCEDKGEVFIFWRSAPDQPFPKEK
jgi:CHAD domain-containing protein